MSTNKKKPISITLAAAIVMCIITFIIGFVLSSFAFLDSRLESASEKNAELSQLVSEREAEIKALKATIDQKDENNIILAEQIQTHLETIESLNSEVSHLKDDVNTISEAAINSDGTAASTFFLSFASLTPSQQLILLVLLLVILIFIISISCSFIAAKSPAAIEKKEKKKKDKKEKKEKKNKKDNAELPLSEESVEESSAESTPDEAGDETEEKAEDITEPEEEAAIEPDEPTMPVDDTIPTVARAIDLLYHNNLEDSIADLGGFKFGITNFDEILSDKRRPKSFGNSESGDFVAFMSTTQTSKKLYIIPRNLVLSDSTVALRGVTDLFSLTNEAGEKIDHGTVKIKQVSSPAVFACGDSGWFIESKGEIVALGTKTY